MDKLFMFQGVDCFHGLYGVVNIQNLADKQNLAQIRHIDLL